MKIIIGADELILWLRKNGKAQNIPNDEFQGLGAQICKIITKDLGGKKLSSEDVKWDFKSGYNICKYELPKTAH